MTIAPCTVEVPFMRNLFVHFFGMVPLLLLSSVCHGQSAISSTSQSPTTNQQTGAPIASSSSSTASLQSLQAQQQALAQAQQQLIAQGATPQQLQAWQQQNAAAIAQVQQEAQTLAAASTAQLEPTNRSANIPANASAALQAFLTTRTTLANARAQIHNQLIQQATASGQTLTPAQVQQIAQQEETQYQQQYGAEEQVLAQQTQALAVESAQRAASLSSNLSAISSNASPPLAAYLTAKNKLNQSLAQLIGQYATADPQTRQAAILQWHQQNAAQFQQLQQMARNLQANPPN